MSPRNDWVKAVALIREAMERGEIQTNLTPEAYLTAQVLGKPEPDGEAQEESGECTVK